MSGLAFSRVFFTVVLSAAARSKRYRDRVLRMSVRLWVDVVWNRPETGFRSESHYRRRCGSTNAVDARGCPRSVRATVYRSIGYILRKGRPGVTRQGLGKLLACEPGRSFQPGEIGVIEFQFDRNCISDRLSLTATHSAREGRRGRGPGTEGGFGHLTEDGDFPDSRPLNTESMRVPARSRAYGTTSLSPSAKIRRASPLASLLPAAS